MAKLAALLPVFGWVGSLSAATFYWDADALAGNGATDGSGSWINAASTKNWYDGGRNNSKWPGNAAGTAVFGNGASGIFTVLLENNAIKVGALRFGALSSGRYEIVATDAANGLTLSAATPTITVHNAGGALIAVKLIGATTGTGVTKAGAGTLTLTHAASALSGPVNIASGALAVGTLANGGALSSLGASSNAAGNLVIHGGATFAYVGAAAARTDRLFTLANNAGEATVANDGSGTLTFSNTGAVAFDAANRARTLTLSGTNTGDNLFTLSIGDNGTAQTSLIKRGIGRWALSGLSAYTGATLVAEGTLLQNGSAALSAHTVSSGATLGGAGTVGAVTLNAGAFLSPGASGAGAAGMLSVSGDLLWNAGGVMRFDLGAAGVSDRVLLGGALRKGGAGAYAFDFLGGGETGAAYTLISGSASSDFSAANFSYVNLRAGLSGMFSFSGNDLVFTVVPEPREYALAAGTIAALAAFARRRHRHRHRAA